jgi:DNA-directed RNA polymerase subunit RPC12/RpoP
METNVQEEILYAIAVHGYAPEFWPAAAFRRKGRFEEETERRKEIKCPYCGRLFMRVGVSRKLELYRYPKRVTLNCDEYRKCNICHEKIGIIYLAG